jgi:magnesium transporter
MVELYRDLIMGTRDIYLSSISNHLNQIMKILTIITVMALPATIVTSFFGMNFEGVGAFNRTLKSSAGFWLSMGTIFVLMLGLIYLFSRRKWL